MTAVVSHSVMLVLLGIAVQAALTAAHRAPLREKCGR